MKCLICKTIIIDYNISLQNFFKRNLKKFCSKCINLYPIIVREIIIPKNNSIIKNYFLEGSINNLSKLAYINFFDSVILDILKLEEKPILLYLDCLNIKVYEYLEKIEEDIYLITNKKEEYI